MLLTYTHQTGAAKKVIRMRSKQTWKCLLKNGLKTWASVCRCMYSIKLQWLNCLPLFSTSEHQEVFSTPVFSRWMLCFGRTSTQSAYPLCRPLWSWMTPFCGLATLAKEIPVTLTQALPMNTPFIGEGKKGAKMCWNANIAQSVDLVPSWKAAFDTIPA